MLISIYCLRGWTSGGIMLGNKTGAIALKSIGMTFMLGAAWVAIAQDAKTPYPSMAPVDQYLMEDKSSEIALARSAAPESISRDAEVLGGPLCLNAAAARPTFHAPSRRRS
jgi:hypothetical protein